MGTDKQEADMLTKSLPAKRFQLLRSLLGIFPIMLIAIVLFGNNCNAFRVNLKSKASPIRGQLTLKVENPCAKISAKIKSIEKDMSKSELSHGYKVNVSMTQVTFDLCEGVFKNKIDGNQRDVVLYASTSTQTPNRCTFRCNRQRAKICRQCNKLHSWGIGGINSNL